MSVIIGRLGDIYWLMRLPMFNEYNTPPSISHTEIFTNGCRTTACKKHACIYGWKNNVTKKWYIGKTKNIFKRLSSYKRGKFKGQLLFYRAVEKYGMNNFTCYELQHCCDSAVAMNYWERFWIREKDSFGPNGYNLTPGGDGAQSITDDIRKKLSLAGQGRKHSVSTRLKMKMNGNRGKKFGPMPADTRKKISISSLNKWASSEFRESMREAHTGRKNSEATILKMKASAKRRWEKRRNLISTQ